MRSKLVQKGIGGGVIGLTGISQHGSYAGEQYEKIQVSAQRGPVQVPGTQYLGPQHILKPVPGLISDCPVGEDTYAVDYSGERRELVIDSSQHCIYGRFAGNVGDLNANLHTPLGQLVNHHLSVSIRLSAAVEDNGTGAILRQPASDGTADSSHTPGYQVGTIVAETLPG